MENFNKNGVLLKDGIKFTDLQNNKLRNRFFFTFFFTKIDLKYGIQSKYGIPFTFLNLKYGKVEKIFIKYTVV